MIVIIVSLNGGGGYEIMQRQLPALAFNEKSTRDVVGYDSYRRYREQTNGNVVAVESLIPKSEFLAKASDLNINELHIRAQSNTPINAERLKIGVSNLWVLKSGVVHSYTARSRLVYEAGKAAFLSAEDHKFFTTSYQSNVRISLDERRLSLTKSAMLGTRNQQARLDKSRIIPLEHQGISFSTLFQNLFNQIDAVSGDENILRLMNVDDAILRLCVALFNFDEINVQGANRNNRNLPRTQITRLCEYLCENLTKPFSLTEMEEFSGLSARVLQYSFQKSFGLRPKEWLRKQRLHAARAILEQPDQQIKMTALAYDFCFPSPSNFAKHYQGEFGELPSQTAAKRMSLILR